LCIAGGQENGAGTMKNSGGSSPPKLKIELYDLAIPLMGVYILKK